MNGEHTDLIGALFAAASAKLESAHQASVDGQGHELRAADIGTNATAVTKQANDAVALVAAAVILIDNDVGELG